MDKGSNRSILWDHFVDVLVVLIMEAALGALITALEPFFPAWTRSWWYPTGS